MDEIPYGLSVEFTKERCSYTSKCVEKLNGLADRGIVLNTWQVNDYLLDGNRAVGKTFLAFVKIAEEFKEVGIDTSKILLSRYDTDVTRSSRHKPFLQGLKNFLEEFYSDVYVNITITMDRVTAEVPKSNRWWI